MIGILIEMYYFSSGLAYKSVILENETLEIKNNLIQQLKLNENILIEKNELQHTISRDLHDDLGSDLSAINFNSQTLLQNLENPKLSHQLTQKINENSQEITQKLKTFIWALDDSKDCLSNFVDYIKIYTLKQYENTNIAVNFSENMENKDLKIDGFIRKNLFLIIKECLNNCLKHAEATKLNFSLTQKNATLNIKIEDNGKGLKTNNPFGNGLHNIRKRIESIGGSVTFQSENGTKIFIEAKL